MNRTFVPAQLTLSKDLIAALLGWAVDYSDEVAFLYSNNYRNHDPYSKYDALLAVGKTAKLDSSVDQNLFDLLRDFSDRHNDWIFGFLSYDLKNQLENIESLNPDAINLPLLNFFVPEYLFIWSNDKCQIGLPNNQYDPEGRVNAVLSKLPVYKRKVYHPQISRVERKICRNDYIEAVSEIKKHIIRGDIYEANYCTEFYVENAKIDPVSTYCQLNSFNPSPFSTFYRHKNKYLISSSPERFLAKRGRMIISQPIKGTIKRGTNPSEDYMLKQSLFNSTKEKSENVMIVDLVRNDLARTAVAGSVQVAELFGIYTFRHVHQMISTIRSEMDPKFHFIDVIKNAFPMGSMTGAPKLRAMQLIENYEKTRRGLYSGAVGYISPEKDFDFNVVIRSILYNQQTNYLNFMAGSAITALSEPEKEYNECLLKAEAIKRLLTGRLNF